jgi:hypothetical protein
MGQCSIDSAVQMVWNRLSALEVVLVAPKSVDEGETVPLRDLSVEV